MLKQIRLFIKQMLCDHEKQNFIENISVLEGEGVSKWRCVKCNDIRYGEYLITRSSEVYRVRKFGEWTTKDLALIDAYYDDHLFARRPLTIEECYTIVEKDQAVELAKEYDDKIEEIGVIYANSFTAFTQAKRKLGTREDYIANRLVK